MLAYDKLMELQSPLAQSIECELNKMSSDLVNDAPLLLLAIRESDVDDAYRERYSNGRIALRCIDEALVVNKDDQWLMLKKYVCG